MSQTETQLQCPYCWEIITVLVDITLKKQSYVEDCSVCCRPITLTIQSDEKGQIALTAAKENG